MIRPVILGLVGFQAPPMYGDYEAQRHWMEITTQLPTSQWYRYDLQWWGLDYPPLTAFHSWLCGKIGSQMQPDWFALDSSRGHESPESKFFMRSTVIVSEALIYIPAVLVFCHILYGTESYLKKYIAATLILMQPALLMIDHGHFQYNSVMLGLALWAINGFLTNHYVLGSIFFCASLAFKQMALYYAPAVFAFLLGKCFQKGPSLFFKLAITVMLTFGILFAPWLTSLDDFLQVVHRIFPVARGLYEDKVANVWCALNIVIKLRQILTLETTLKLSLFTTIVAVLPTSIHLGLSPSRKRFIYALVNSSMAFYLLSFQVHEKSILLPALPITLLMIEEPVAVSIFMRAAMFSMFPLLKREGLALPYFVTTELWNYLARGHGSEVNRTEYYATMDMKKMTNVAFVLWHAIEWMIPPPAHLPDIYTVFNAVISCGIFCTLYLYFVYRQFNLVSSTNHHRKTHMARRVVVTGLGLVTPVGVGVKTAWNNLLNGHCGVTSLAHVPEYEKLPVRIAARVPEGPKDQGQFTPNEWLDRGDERTMAKFTQYALAAARQALNDAEWIPQDDLSKQRTGVCIGSGMGSLEDIVSASLAYSASGHRKISPMFVPRILVNMAAGHLTMKHGFQGPNHAVSTACTTGAHSLGDAARFIQYGDADVMVAGGTEAAIHPLAIAGFAKYEPQGFRISVGSDNLSRAKSLASGYDDHPTASSRPFDSDRSGFVMGEGAGVVVLEELEHAKRRGAKIYAELRGYGLSGDAHHMTAPPEDGRGAALSMKRALAAAKLGSAEIDYINAHATSTPVGDAAENRAIKQVFEGYWNKINVSSTKGATGHLLGAAGSVEAIFTILAVHHNILPPTLNLHKLDEEFNLNYVPLMAQEGKEIRAALTNSFGFGGTNATLCFTKVDK
ncbi:Mitochondrial beta-keto-acyl synthase [Apophysomyces ossiformis]|uniref:3-oxoacyl-[acyl-carrier-protein] synthase, mitochondrial n=1 Tax=Apophysomyces ossiformis TaxID=679940 RepID=A0A8H7ELE8_9FUNG|nr:Mitochondrial beta-keto-acyl synthase [Apophysomyces ossiformis]